MPSRSITPGRKFSTRTSAWVARSRTICAPSGLVMSTVIPRLPRLTAMKWRLFSFRNGVFPARRAVSPPGGESAARGFDEVGVEQGPAGGAAELHELSMADPGGHRGTRPVG